MIKLKKFAAKTNKGPYLQVNEDEVEVDLYNKLYLLMDGFGGASIGDECVKSIKTIIKGFYSRLSKDPDATMPFFFSSKYLLECNAFINSLFLAHKEILGLNSKKEMNGRGGASLIGLTQSENILSFVSVGNCSSYLFRRGQTYAMTYPDDLFSLSTETSQRHKYSCPMSGIGLFQDLQFQTRELRATRGDVVALFTDGVSAYLELQEINAILGDQSKGLSEKIDAFHELANSRGNMDNQSTVLLHY